MPRALCAVLGLLAAASALALSPAPAAAGTYPMRTCNVPGQPRASTGPWTWENAAHSQGFSECATGGPFGFVFPNLLQMSPFATASLVLRRPPSGAMSAIGLRQARLWLRADLRRSGGSLFVNAQTMAGTNTDIWGPPGGDHSTVGWSSPIFSAENPQFRLSLFCADDAAGQPCAVPSQYPLLVQGALVTLSEDVAPRGTIAGGALTSGAQQAGVRNAAFEAADDESGVARMEALLDGAVAGAVDLTGTAHCTYDHWNACDPTSNGEVGVDTRTVPDGAHTLQLRVTDAAGNQRLAQAPQPVLVANGSRPVVRGAENGTGASDAARLSVRFAGRRGTAISKRWSAKATVRGRLTTAAGTPIRGALIDVRETPATGSARARPGVRTARDGSFRYVVAPKRSSRRIRFAYRSHVEDTVPAAARDVRVRVRAAAALRVRLTGILVRYAGRVLSRPLPRGGKVVHVQGRAKGGTWQTFATKRASRTGRFSGRYRLKVRRPGVRLQFRVLLPSQSGYPYAAAGGGAVTRRVR